MSEEKPALSRWRGTETGIEIDAARLTPDNLDELWQEFESKPHYDQDSEVDGLALYTDTGRQIVLFGEWACRFVDDGLPFKLADELLREMYEPAEAPVTAQTPGQAAWPRDPGFRLITDTSGTRHVVDAGGVRQLTEVEAGTWELAIASANQAGIVQFATGILALWQPDRPRRWTEQLDATRLALQETSRESSQRGAEVERLRSALADIKDGYPHGTLAHDTAHAALDQAAAQ